MKRFILFSKTVEIIINLEDFPLNVKKKLSVIDDSAVKSFQHYIWIAIKDSDRNTLFTICHNIQYFITLKLFF